MKQLFFAIITWVLSSTSFAQLKMTDLKISGELTPGSNYLMPNGNDTEFIEGHTKTSAKTFQSRFNLAINLNLSTKFDTINNSLKIWSASVNSDHILLNNTGYINKVLPSSLNASSITLRRLKTLKNNWSFLGLMTLGVNSDYSKIDGHDLFAFVGAAWIKAFSDKFSLGTGIMVHNSFGKPLPWPLITVNWQMGGKFRLNVDAPDQSPGLAYNISFRYFKNLKSDFAVFFRPSNISYDVDFTTNNRRLLNYWQIPIGLDMQTHYKHIDLTYRINLMAVRSFSYAEKELEKMFSKYPSHLLAPNISFGIDLKLKKL